MIRAFVAVNLEQSIRDRIGEAEKDFDIKGIKPVDPALIHVTMKFLGNVEESRVDEIAAALGKVKVPPFTARIRSIGGFPNARSPRVIWIGAEPGETFAEMNRQVEDALAGIGFEREGRFKPHVTIGRVKFPDPAQKQKLPLLFEKYRDFDAGAMRVDRLHLMKSTLSPKGPKYEALREISL
ncbi:MAG: 2',5' RNA ligase family [Methanocella sp. PtaU1.Bin125]|nr:MAG: 2',5' RNA ligase family [Methanocella sp. PtaU1.Bin125]